VNDLHIEELTSLAAAEAFEPEWRQLWERSPDATPFHSPDWLVPWLRHLWGGGRLCLLVARSGGGRAVAAAPFFFWGYGQRPEIIRVSLVGSGISDYLGMLAEPESARAAAAAVWNALGKRACEFHVCDLQELAPACPLLHAPVPEHFHLDEAPSGTCPVLSLPARYEDLVGRLPGKFRTDLRRASNRLRAAGTVEFLRASANDLEQHLSTLFRLHAERWETRRQHGVLSTERLQSFHRDAAGRLQSRGVLRLYSLRLDGLTIAVQYNFLAGRRSYAYLAGFCPEVAKLSPGAVLLAHSIEQAIGEGACEFDFLRKGEAFKYQWGAADRVNRRLLVTRAATRCREVA
jgi:CelD/BcsL family acetyltransferase involved in cellulose biosynthesis